MSLTFSFIEEQIIIYATTPVLIAGVIGNLLNTLVFLSLRTFRKSSCALYLTIMSISSIGVLFLGLLSRIIIALVGIDELKRTSLTCISLATIDQYFATCSRLHWQRFCSIKLVQCAILIAVTFFTLQCIPYLVFYEHIFSSTTDTVTCVNKNNSLTQYRTFAVLLLLGYLPVIVSTVFSGMAYRNVQQMTRRPVPLVRRELDKQLTKMVLTQMIINIPTILAFPTVFAISTNPYFTSNSTAQAYINLMLSITVVIYHVAFGTPFYIYICVSKRFRRQLIFVLFTVHLNRCRPTRIEPINVHPDE